MFEPFVEVLHLIAKLLDIIDHDKSIGSHLWDREEEIVEVFSLHSIDIDEVEKSIRKRRNDLLGISPNRMNMFHLAIAKVLDGFYVCVPGGFDGGDRELEYWRVGILEGWNVGWLLRRISGVFEQNRGELECGVAIRGSDLEDMFRVFLMDEVLDKIRILFGNIRNIAFESDFLEIAEVCGEELRHI